MVHTVTLHRVLSNSTIQFNNSLIEKLLASLITFHLKRRQIKRWLHCELSQFINDVAQMFSTHFILILHLVRTMKWGLKNTLCIISHTEAPFHATPFLYHFQAQEHHYALHEADYTSNQCTTSTYNLIRSLFRPFSFWNIKKRSYKLKGSAVMH